LIQIIHNFEKLADMTEQSSDLQTSATADGYIQFCQNNLIIAAFIAGGLYQFH